MTTKLFLAYQLQAFEKGEVSLQASPAGGRKLEYSETTQSATGDVWKLYIKIINSDKNKAGETDSKKNLMLFFKFTLINFRLIPTDSN